MERIADGVWGFGGVQGMPGGVRFPLRMTALATSGGVWLYSPVPLDEEAARAVDALGRVVGLIAPSRMHHLHLEAARARWPDASVLVAPGLLDTHSGAIPLTAGPLADGALEVLPIAGAPRVDEHVVLHRPSGSLLVTDLMFHVLEPEGLPTRALLFCVGCSGRLAISRSWRWVFVDDRDAFMASLRAIRAWDPARVVPCHGAVGDRAALDAALATWIG